ncbi:MAG: 3-dehydroquinate synthase [Burkholderiaceae bacterium]|nr:3-dehydroquinate synthase [Burkholderiaceae bacterium]
MSVLYEIPVELHSSRYRVMLGSELSTSIQSSELFQAASQIILVTNSTLEVLYSPFIELLFKEVTQAVVRVTLADGEHYKTWASLDKIHSAMLAAKCDRNCLVLAFGGGVVGDIAGFAAATYMRGVKFVQIPTTLLAQVDSSVGGKTAINHPLGKNMIGAFHQPSAVYADMALLQTLPKRELSAGIAEVIKHGLLADRALFDWLHLNMSALLAFNPTALLHVVKRSVEIKAKIVGEDETETGVRALLNLGHTFGHALEAVLGYGSWLHGEAVGCGLVLAGKLSQRLGMIHPTQVQKIEEVVASAHLPVRVPAEAPTQALLEAMLHDKKNQQGQLRFVVLEALGKATVQTVPLALAKEVIDKSR